MNTPGGFEYCFITEACFSCTCRQETLMAKTIFDGNRISSSIIPKSDKISAEAKKGARYYKRGVLQGTGWKSWDKRFVVDWGGRQRQRRQKRQTGLYRNIRILQRQAGSHRTENRPEIRQVGTLDCYSTCQCSALLNGVFVSRNGFPVRVVSFLRIIVSV